MEDMMPVQARRSSRKACMRCHRRKQRCVGYPSCTSCEAANLTCQRTAPSSRRFARLSKQELLDKLDLIMANRNAAEASPVASPSMLSPLAQTPHHDESMLDNSRDDQVLGEDHTLTASEVQFPVHTTSEGECSMHAASDTHHRVDAASGDNIWVRESSHMTDRPGDNGLFVRDSPPNDELGEQLLVMYLKNLHRRTPFVNLAEILDAHDRRHQGFLADARSEYHGFLLYMVYAIGATVLQLTRPCYNSTASPEKYLARALDFKSMWKGEQPVREVESTLLLVFYKLRTSLDSRVWYLIGHAVRTAIDIGMHREHYYRNLDPETAHSRRRLFWSVYSMERRIAWSLRRPYSIADHDIDTLETQPTDYTVPDTLSAVRLDKHTSSHGHSSSSQTDIIPASYAVFALTRITSRVYVDIYSVGKARSDLRNEVPSLLEQFKQLEPLLSAVPDVDRDWVLIHYHDSIRKTIEPVLRILEPQDELMQLCLQASGRMCQMFKRMRMKTLCIHSFLMINALFIAGMNMW